MDRSQKDLLQLCSLTGLLAIVFYLLHDVAGALNYPGYQWMSQAVSDLTAADAPSLNIARGYSAVYGIFSCICCVASLVLFQGKHRMLVTGVALFTVMNLVSAIGYSLFPLSSAGYDGSFQSVMHMVVTGAVVLLSIVSLVCIIIGACRQPQRSLAVFAGIALALMFIGSVGSGAVPKAYFGVVERLSTYSAVLFTGVLGVYACRQ